jgi:CubicO group peptidase (beta-lactamase class C family)
LLGDDVLVPYVSMVGLGESLTREKGGANPIRQVIVAPASGRGTGMIRKFEGGARHIRASGLRIILFSVVLAGTAPLAAHGQSFEHATKDKVMAALPALEIMAQRIVDEDQVPGLSIAVVYRDEVVYLKGFGVREAGAGEAVDADTVFQLASLSKPIASTVVAALVGDKAVSWDSRIADIDPTFQLYEAYPTAQVTLRDLFATAAACPEAPATSSSSSAMTATPFFTASTW